MKQELNISNLDANPGRFTNPHAAAAQQRPFQDLEICYKTALQIPELAEFTESRHY
jgi:hypothetical protein